MGTINISREDLKQGWPGRYDDLIRKKKKSRGEAYFMPESVGEFKLVWVERCENIDQAAYYKRYDFKPEYANQFEKVVHDRVQIRLENVRCYFEGKWANSKFQSGFLDSVPEMVYHVIRNLESERLMQQIDNYEKEYEEDIDALEETKEILSELFDEIMEIAYNELEDNYEMYKKLNQLQALQEIQKSLLMYDSQNAEFQAALWKTSAMAAIFSAVSTVNHAS